VTAASCLDCFQRSFEDCTDSRESDLAFDFTGRPWCLSFKCATQHNFRKSCSSHVIVTLTNKTLLLCHIDNRNVTDPSTMSWSVGASLMGLPSSGGFMTHSSPEILALVCHQDLPAG